MFGKVMCFSLGLWWLFAFSPAAAWQIVLESGHLEKGGWKTFSGTEKEWNRRFQKALESAFAEKGWAVLTFPSSAEQSLHKRVEWLEKQKANVFLSVHVDFGYDKKKNRSYCVLFPKTTGPNAGGFQRVGEKNEQQWYFSVQLATFLVQAWGGEPVFFKAGEAETGGVVSAPHRALLGVRLPAVVMVPTIPAEDAKKLWKEEKVLEWARQTAEGLEAFRRWLETADRNEP